MPFGTPPPREATPGTGAVKPDPDNPPWGAWAALGLLVMSFFLMLVTSVGFLIPYVVYRNIRLDTLAEFAVKDPGAIFVQILSIIPAHLLTLVLAWLLVTRAGKHPFFGSLGWEWRGGFTFWRSAGLAVLLLGLGYAIARVTGPTDNALEQLLRSSRAAALAVAFAAAVTAPLVEEVVFRGVLYSALRRRLGAVASVIAVLVVFAAIHFPQYIESAAALVTITLLSLVLTVVRAWTGRLLPCVVLHLLFNGITSLAIVFWEEGADKVPVPPPAPPTGALVQLFDPLFRLLF
jgi:membrane protease YdiL (CAAX protease family)